jgi:uncharacterized protein DUF1186/SEC-C motif-containing protein
MDVHEILEQLARSDGLPVDAIRAAEADRAAMVPAFLDAVDAFLSASADERAKPSPIFFIFHLLGSWREKSAYRPLARLLLCPRRDIDPVLGDAITETSPQIMAAVFDGDPQPLYEIILDPKADEFVRWSMCDTVAIVTLQGELPRSEAARFLAACFTHLKSTGSCCVWDGWQSAVAALGLVELRPQVKEAFERGWIDPMSLSFEDFEEDLNATLLAPDAPAWFLDRHRPFGDLVEEFSTWGFASQSDQEDDAPGTSHSLWAPEQAVNPFKKVGRNDPCPCGSGKKFKKCCLDAYREAPFQGEAA